MLMEPGFLIAAGVAVVGSGGAAWAGTKASLNGTRKRVSRIEGQFDEEIPRLRRTLRTINERTVRIEEQLRAAKLDREEKVDA